MPGMEISFLYVPITLDVYAFLPEINGPLQKLQLANKCFKRCQKEA